MELGLLPFPLLLLLSVTSTPLLFRYRTSRKATLYFLSLVFPAYFLFHTWCFHLTHLHSPPLPPITKHVLFRDNNNPLINKSIPSYTCPPLHSIRHNSLTFSFCKLTLPRNQIFCASTSQTNSALTPGWDSFLLITPAGQPSKRSFLSPSDASFSTAYLSHLLHTL